VPVLALTSKKVKAKGSAYTALNISKLIEKSEKNVKKLKNMEKLQNLKINFQTFLTMTLGRNTE